MYLSLDRGEFSVCGGIESVESKSTLIGIRMGHERIGKLPKTQRWRAIVESMGEFSEAGTGGGAPAIDIAEIVRQTTDNLHNRLDRIEQDESLLSAFKFLVALAVSARSASPPASLRDLGIEVPPDPSPLTLARSLQNWMPARVPSLEYATMSRNAAMDAIAAWSARAERPTDNLFGVGDRPFDVWRRASTGSGFCELSSVFFGKFVERYFGYFLEREASAVLPTISAREQFSKNLSEHVQQVAQHAMETAKITQSFAAGWFNRHAKEGVPPNASIRGFLKLAFEKLREELRREGKL